MRIGIAARGLIEKSGGVKQYIESLIFALLKIDKNNEYVVYYNTKDFLGTYPNAKEVVLNSKNKLMWDFILLPPAVKRDKIDVMLFTKNVVPFGITCKSVVVNYDLGYFIDWLNEYKLFDQLYMRTMISASVKRTDSVIAISEHTKKDLVTLAGANADKIKVIYLAADGKYKLINDSDKLTETKHKYGLTLPFIFHCGSLSPRKNIARLLKAFALIKHKIPHQLVFTAGKSWKDKQINDLALDLGLGDRITKLGHINDGDMPIIYNLADVYVYPSIYEGFGLPVLEAMACGCPVITSSATSLPEVAGDAAVIVDPYNINQLSEAIYNVLTDNDLKQALINKGFEQAKKFSWEKTAQKTLEVFGCLMQ